MKLEQIEFEPVRYSLRLPLRTAKENIEERCGFLVRIRDADAASGCGEALPLPSAGTESLEKCVRSLEEARTALRGQRASFDEILDELEKRWPHAPAARCALDVALHDLEARKKSLPLAALLARTPRERVAVNALVSAQDLAATVRSCSEAARRGYRTLKLKLGTNLEADVKRLRAVRETLGPKMRLRVDANGSWSFARARKALEVLAPLVELIEQPLAATERTDAKRLYAASSVPLAADESLAREEGRADLLGGQSAHIAVLKPMVLGGLRASARLARAAMRVQVRSFVTTTLDGPVGTAAALHLAAAVGDATLASGLDSSTTLNIQFPDFLTTRNGELRIPSLPGLGLETGN
ncbi:MAG: o-succinylbenzoate synthase [bacterium]|nr:o-succinylbenzoate synthase [bacterium]